MIRRLCIGILLSTVAFAQSSDGAYTFTTLAGAPPYGNANGPAATAEFNDPCGIAIDRTGTMYVADNLNQVVRKITPDGTVSTYAGTLLFPGYLDGPAATAKFGSVNSVAVDSLGNVYVADATNYAIRKISVDGVVSTFAGGRPGGTSVDGVGTAASFLAPTSVAVDAAGNVYVEDEDNTRSDTRKITPAGVVTTLRRGSETGYPHFIMQTPSGIAVAPDGTIYYSDYGRSVIGKISTDGTVSILAGSDNVKGVRDGPAEQALFGFPMGLSVGPDGAVYVTDNSRLRKIANGTVSTIATIPATMGVASGQPVAAEPSSVAFDAAGNAYVTCRNSNSIRRIAPDGTEVTFAGLEGSDGYLDGQGLRARFNQPAGIALGPDRCAYVADARNNAIRKVTSAGAVTTIAGGNGQGIGVDGPASIARFLGPRGLAVDRSGVIYVADSGDCAIRKITTDGTVTTIAGTINVSGSADGIGSAALFNDPEGIAVGSDGTLYVTDTGNRTIRKISPDGTVTTLAGVAGEGWPLVDGKGAAARFDLPTGITIDGIGNLYVDDGGMIRKVSPAGDVSTIYSRTMYGSGVSAPNGIAIDPSGNLYLTDNGLKVITKIAPDGTGTFIGGAMRRSGSSDGTGSDARFAGPFGIAVDADGNVFIADSGNNTIRIGSPRGPVLTAALTGAPSINFGDTQTLTLGASAAIGYQWSVNGQTITDATGPTYTAAFPGHYSVTAWNAAGAVTSDVTIATPHRLKNISGRAEALGGINEPIVGFAIAGPNGTTKSLLIRGVGPALPQLGISNPVLDPTITLYDGGQRIIATNTGWCNAITSSGGNVAPNVQSAMASVMASAGAFALPSGSADSAMVAALSPGSYTTPLLSATNRGVGLAELYETNADDAALVTNVSLRAHIGTGEAIAIAGFVITGTQPAQILVRGIGPTLSALGVDSPLTMPVLRVYDSTSALIATNIGWSTAPQPGNSPIGSATTATVSAMQQVGAFPLPVGSADCAMSMTLPPGGYTATLSGAGNSTGVGLIEVYLVR